MMFIEVTQPMRAYALTEGPSQPEFNSFTPIGTSDMVDLASGDFNYNIPIMDVGGYPINLAYNAGVSMDQEASWVGLGWNLNVGQINRDVRGIPDDFKGDEIETQNNLKPNVTVSITPYINPQAWGFLDNTIRIGAGLEVRYNNYTGLAANPTLGASFNLGKNVSLGLQLSTSDEMGASVSPSVSLNPLAMMTDKKSLSFNPTVGGGLSYNSRQGLQSFNLSTTTPFSGTNPINNKTMGNINFGKSFSVTTFTPTKRIAFQNNQYTFSFSVGGSFFGVQGEGSLTASATIQTIKDKFKIEKAYGYENTELAGKSDILDFNRENELSTVSKSTNVLPVTNYTYDLLSIQSQGLSGQIRPYRSQAGYVYDPYVSDNSSSTSLSGEIEAGWGVHYGASIKYTSGVNYTSLWGSIATPYLKEKSPSNIDYEKVYYKMVGEQHVDEEQSRLLNQNFGGNSPVTLSLSTDVLMNKYAKKTITGGYNSSLTNMSSFSTSDLRRAKREQRNKVIQKLTKKEALDYNLNNKFVNINSNALDHHIAGFLITDENGNKTVFGETAYNIEKNEVSFATNSQNINCERGTVIYNNGDNSINNTAGIDRYFNSVKTKQYAHTYLITSILSSDYQDIDGNGPSDSDLGNYTKFTYTTGNDLGYNNNYKWRVPFGKQKYEASYNEGFKSHSKDQKASYLYGVKEVKYVKRIETKTHVALFDLVERRDGYGVIDKNGLLDNNCKTYFLKSIRLYAKKPGVVFYENDNVKPIKTAHFEYDYSLCPGIDNNSGQPQIFGDQDINSERGKLTLKKVYFTYENSNMGKYTPYKFNYSNNKPYNPKNYDIWGTYKALPTPGNCQDLSIQEFPFVQQDDHELQNEFASSWTLSEIELPSGGLIKVKYESDDYQYVQNKRAMQMFKVLGVTENFESQIRSSLYGDGYDAKYVVIHVDHPGATPSETIKRYTDGLKGKPIFFDFFMNMTDSKSDHVTGYFELDKNEDIKYSESQQNLYLPMKKVSREGTSGNATNPITVAGWFFGRQHLHRQIYNLPQLDEGVPNPVDLGIAIMNGLEPLVEIFIGPNGRLKMMGRAKQFDPTKSWVRLNEPTGVKLGGGLRVKSVEVYDGWENMLDPNEVAGDLSRYQKKYGQEYTYLLEDGKSSGVATFEPNISKENPFVEPFYNDAEKLSAQTYTEKPFGASFFPRPAITYSRVSVKNITSADDDDDSTGEVRKTRSGEVVTTHYTSYDFPTKTDFTNLDGSKFNYSNEEAALPNILLGMLGLNIEVKNELTLTQGFQIETNDMNGKVKKREVKDNNGNLISYESYEYYVENNDPTQLDNTVTVIDHEGKVTQRPIGVEFDLVNDLRYNYNYSSTVGVNGNLEVIPIITPFFFWILYVGTAFFDNESHSQTFRSAVTTKVIHRTGILKEKKVFDLGSSVSTRNMAWDAMTGQVILTNTDNEFGDSYYNLSYPAYWHYDRMGMSSRNIDIKGRLLAPTGGTQQAPNPYFKLEGYLQDLSSVFQLGDELYIRHNGSEKKVWVFGFNANKTGVLLMDSGGNYIDKCGNEGINYTFRIIRSGYRNNQMVSMASVQLMANPIASGQLINPTYMGNAGESNPRILNSTAVEFKDFWEPQRELNMKIYPNVNPNQTPLAITAEQITFPTILDFNPYLYNHKGNWRLSKTLKFLTGRKGAFANTNSTNIRNNGFYGSYLPYYSLDSNKKWIKSNNDKWTNAGEVTKFSPYGAELENVDALGRYSSAQYNYIYTKPMALASNAQHREIGFEGFEDHNFGPGTSWGYRNRFSIGGDYYSWVSTIKSHSGKRSVAITKNPNNVPTTSINLQTPTKVQSLVNCVQPTPCPNCPSGWYEPNCNCPTPGPCGINLSTFNNNTLTLYNPTSFGLSYNTYSTSGSISSRIYYLEFKFYNPDGLRGVNPIENLCPGGFETFYTYQDPQGYTTLSLYYTTYNLWSDEFKRVKIKVYDCESNFYTIDTRLRFMNSSGQTASQQGYINNSSCTANF